jgi:hypothetical protein
MRTLLSASVAALLAVPAAAEPGGPLEVVARVRTPPLAEPVLDLAMADDETIVVLSAQAVALYRWGRDGLTLDSRQLLPGPASPVRAPGGILTPLDDSRAFWALTSGASAAALYRIEGRQLLANSEAGALPWSGSPEGLRFRPGTNLIEGRIASLGPGPFLALEPGVAVEIDGGLRVSGEASEEAALRVGSSLARLGEGLLAASSAEPPGSEDALLLIEATAQGWRVARTLPVEGAIRALAARPRDRTCRLVAAVEEPGRPSHLLILDLAPNP